MSYDKKITAPRAAATAQGQSNVTNTVSIAEEYVHCNPIAIYIYS
jgi:hypothetical protein